MFSTQCCTKWWSSFGSSGIDVMALQLPASFEVEPLGSTHSLRRSSSVATAVAMLGGQDPFQSFQGSDQGRPASWQSVFLLILAFVLIASMSGGLIFGSAPFQAALVDYGYSMEEAKHIWGLAFQVFVVGTAMVSPLLDYIAPRWFASFGLALECFGHHLLAGIAAYPLQEGRYILAAGLGIVGVGGNMLMLSSIQFSGLFVNSCTITAMMSGTYQLAGFIFSLLDASFMNFEVFFHMYEIISLVGMGLAFICYPNEPYTSSLQPAGCTWPTMPCRPCGGAPSSCKDSWAPLQLSRTWFFLLSFSLGATCGAWCSATFLQTVTRKAQAAGELPSAVDAFVVWMPFVSNATFVFSPCIGMLIDLQGFVPAVQILLAMVLSAVLSLWLLPFNLQWWTLLSLNCLQAVTYSLQFTYTARRYRGEQFGIIMGFTTVIQSVVNIGGLYLLTAPAGLAAAAFIVPTCFTCLMWCLKERRDISRLLPGHAVVG